MLHPRVRRLLISAAAAALPSAGFAQVSDSWAVDVGTAGGSWSVASNWANGMIPDGGGTATFGTLPTFTTAPLAIFQDLPTVTLGGLYFPTQITYQLRAPAAAPTNSITLSGAAGVNTPIPSINTLSTTTFGHLIDLPIAGTAGLVKTGPGTATLWRNTNTYTGGTRVEDGILVLRQIGDAALGNAAGSVTLDGGTIRVTTTAWTSARTIQLDAGSGTIEATTTGTTTFNGPVNGGGSLNKMGSRGLTLTAISPYTGATNVLAGSIGLIGEGRLTGTSSITARDAIVIDNSGTSAGNRINDAAPITFHGASLAYIGNGTTGSGEILGDVTFSRGTTTITVTPATGQNAAIQFGNASRDTGGVAFFRGTNLGDAPSPNSGNVMFDQGPTLIGGNGTAGSTNVSIIPWAFGNTNATAALNSATNSFCTISIGGVRPLDPSTEYATTLVGDPTNNVRLTIATGLNNPVTVNSLLLSGTSPFDVFGSSTISVTSGALMSLNNGNNISTPLDFGPAEAIIIAQGSLTLGGVITGSGGLTKQGAGVATFSAPNTYTGTTIIGGGTVAFGGSVASGSASPFGNSTSAIQLAPAGVGTGGTTARLVYTGTSSASFNRDLNVTARIATNNAATPPGFGLTAAGTLNMNGAIALDQTPLVLVGVAGSTLILNGDISGSGPITDQSTSSGTIRLNGSNGFTGGAELSGATWQVGSDTAFGNGGLLKMVQTSGQPTIQAVGGPRTVPNPTVSFSFNSNYWQISGSEDITFTGSINLSGSYTHNINNSALTTYSGVLHTGGFTKAGTGVLVLSGDNVYTGVTTISSGVLRVAHANALGSNVAGTVVASGAALELFSGALTTEPVTISGTGINNRGALVSVDSAGTTSVGDITVAANARIRVESGPMTVGNIDAVSSAVGLEVKDYLLTARRVRVGALALDGEMAIAPGRSEDKTSRITSLSLASPSTLDLGNNDLVIDYTGFSPAGIVKLWLAHGYAGGAWNGSGISSSVAATQTTATLGYAEAADIFTTFPATFSGQSVDNTSVLIRYTIYGDANLDGTTNIGDFSLLAANFNLAGERIIGDFNYDGTTNIGDFSLLAANFNQSLPATTARPSAVPEPAAAGFLGLAGLLVARRRRAWR